MDILEEIVANKRVEVERFKQELSEREIHRRVEAILDFGVASMSQALTASDTGIIAEFKRRSPSKGWIKEEGRADVIPLSYQQNGASAGPPLRCIGCAAHSCRPETCRVQVAVEHSSPAWHGGTT